MPQDWWEDFDYQEEEERIFWEDDLINQLPDDGLDHEFTLELINYETGEVHTVKVFGNAEDLISEAWDMVRGGDGFDAGADSGTIENIGVASISF